MRTKSFSIPKEIGSDLSNTINTVRNNIGSLNYRIVPLDAIEFDPTNPRELAITRNDIIHGLKDEDAYYYNKKSELETLTNLANTIKKYGVINPVEIYRHGNNYRLIHGERRCLGSLLAGKQEIPAKILDSKPTAFDIKVLQLIENVQREDLTLPDFLNNVRVIINEYRNQTDSNVEVNALFLEQILNKSRAQCFNILSVLNAPNEIQEHIKSGVIKNLEKAAIITNEKDTSKRRSLIEMCLAGASISQLKQTKQILKQQRINDQSTEKEPQKIHKIGRKTSKIHMGDTKSIEAIKKLVELVSTDNTYKPYVTIFKAMSFKDYSSCTVAFKQLINLMEKVEAK